MLSAQAPVSIVVARSVSWFRMPLPLYLYTGGYQVVMLYKHTDMVPSIHIR